MSRATTSGEATPPSIETYQAAGGERPGSNGPALAEIAHALRQKGYRVFAFCIQKPGETPRSEAEAIDINRSE